VVRLHGLKQVFFPAAGPIQLSRTVVFFLFIYNKANFKFANRSALKFKLKLKLKLNKI
jgi:hypothetical protein